MRKKLIIIFSILAILIIGIAIAVYIVWNLPQTKDRADKKEKKEVILVHDNNPFITNLKDSDSYLKVDISIEIEDPKEAEILKKNMYKMRDRVIKILRNVSEDDMKRSDIQESLKNEIKQDLKENLKIDTIIGIYFNDFVVQ
ncbi:MAG: flagellar basal body-associated FliL family protein [Clostridiales bacterium]|jgi:flagellar basal body-associated protein FliL|nr:flagellar basal body-associated FliL family protein [Clostridiales bacterium]